MSTQTSRRNRGHRRSREPHFSFRISLMSSSEELKVSSHRKNDPLAATRHCFRPKAFISVDAGLLCFQSETTGVSFGHLSHTSSYGATSFFVSIKERVLPLIHASSFISCLKLPAASSSVRLVRQITALDSDRHIAPKDRNLFVFAPFSTARKTAQLRHSTATQRQRQVVTCWTTTRWRCHTSNIRANIIFHRNLPDSSSLLSRPPPL